MCRFAVYAVLCFDKHWSHHILEYNAYSVCRRTGKFLSPDSDSILKRTVRKDKETGCTSLFFIAARMGRRSARAAVLQPAHGSPAGRGILGHASDAYIHRGTLLYINDMHIL